MNDPNLERFRVTVAQIIQKLNGNDFTNFGGILYKNRRKKLLVGMLHMVESDLKMTNPAENEDVYISVYSAYEYIKNLLEEEIELKKGEYADALETRRNILIKKLEIISSVDNTWTLTHAAHVSTLISALPVAARVASVSKNIPRPPIPHSQVGSSVDGEDEKRDIIEPLTAKIVYEDILVMLPLFNDAKKNPVKLLQVQKEYNEVARLLLMSTPSFSLTKEGTEYVHKSKLVLSRITPLFHQLFIDGDKPCIMSKVAPLSRDDIITYTFMRTTTDFGDMETDKKDPSSEEIDAVSTKNFLNQLKTQEDFYMFTGPWVYCTTNKINLFRSYMALRYDLSLWKRIIYSDPVDMYFVKKCMKILTRAFILLLYLYNLDDYRNDPNSFLNSHVDIKYINASFFLPIDRSQEEFYKIVFEYEVVKLVSYVRKMVEELNSNERSKYIFSEHAYILREINKLVVVLSDIKMDNIQDCVIKVFDLMKHRMFQGMPMNETIKAPSVGYIGNPVRVLTVNDRIWRRTKFNSIEYLHECSELYESHFEFRVSSQTRVFPMTYKGEVHSDVDDFVRKSINVDNTPVHNKSKKFISFVLDNYFPPEHKLLSINKLLTTKDFLQENKHNILSVLRQSDLSPYTDPDPRLIAGKPFPSMGFYTEEIDAITDLLGESFAFQNFADLSSQLKELGVHLHILKYNISQNQQNKFEDVHVSADEISDLVKYIVIVLVETTIFEENGEKIYTYNIYRDSSYNSIFNTVSIYNNARDFRSFLSTIQDDLVKSFRKRGLPYPNNVIQQHPPKRTRRMSSIQNGYETDGDSVDIEADESGYTFQYPDNYIPTETVEIIKDYSSSSSSSSSSSILPPTSKNVEIKVELIDSRVKFPSVNGNFKYTENVTEIKQATVSSIKVSNINREDIENHSELVSIAEVMAPTLSTFDSEINRRRTWLNEVFYLVGQFLMTFCGSDNRNAVQNYHGDFFSYNCFSVIRLEFDQYMKPSIQSVIVPMKNDQHLLGGEEIIKDVETRCRIMMNNESSQLTPTVVNLPHPYCLRLKKDIRKGKDVYIFKKGSGHSKNVHLVTNIMDESDSEVVSKPFHLSSYEGEKALIPFDFAYFLNKLVTETDRIKKSVYLLLVDLYLVAYCVQIKKKICEDYSGALEKCALIGTPKNLFSLESVNFLRVNKLHNDILANWNGINRVNTFQCKDSEFIHTSLDTVEIKLILSSFVSTIQLPVTSSRVNSVNGILLPSTWNGDSVTQPDLRASDKKKYEQTFFSVEHNDSKRKDQVVPPVERFPYASANMYCSFCENILNESNKHRFECILPLLIHNQFSDQSTNIVAKVLSEQNKWSTIFSTDLQEQFQCSDCKSLKLADSELQNIINFFDEWDTGLYHGHLDTTDANSNEYRTEHLGKKVVEKEIKEYKNASFKFFLSSSKLLQVHASRSWKTSNFWLNIRNIIERMLELDTNFSKSQEGRDFIKKNDVDYEFRIKFKQERLVEVQSVPKTSVSVKLNQTVITNLNNHSLADVIKTTTSSIIRANSNNDTITSEKIIHSNNIDDKNEDKGDDTDRDGDTDRDDDDTTTKVAVATRPKRSVQLKATEERARKSEEEKKRRETNARILEEKRIKKQTDNKKGTNINTVIFPEAVISSKQLVDTTITSSSSSLVPISSSSSSQNNLLREHNDMYALNLILDYLSKGNSIFPFYLEDYTRNGNCFFEVIAQGMLDLGMPLKKINNGRMESGDRKPMAKELRKMVLQYIKDSKGDERSGYMAAITADTNNNQGSNSEGEMLQKFLSRLSKDGEYADEPLITAMSSMLKVRIVVFRHPPGELLYVDPDKIRIDEVTRENNKSLYSERVISLYIYNKSADHYFHVKRYNEEDKKLYGIRPITELNFTDEKIKIYRLPISSFDNKCVCCGETVRLDWKTVPSLVLSPNNSILFHSHVYDHISKKLPIGKTYKLVYDHNSTKCNAIETAICINNLKYLVNEHFMVDGKLIDKSRAASIVFLTQEMNILLNSIIKQKEATSKDYSNIDSWNLLFRLSIVILLVLKHKYVNDFSMDKLSNITQSLDELNRHFGDNEDGDVILTGSSKLSDILRDKIGNVVTVDSFNAAYMSIDRPGMDIQDIDIVNELKRWTETNSDLFSENYSPGTYIENINTPLMNSYILSLSSQKKKNEPIIVITTSTFKIVHSGTKLQLQDIEGNGELFRLMFEIDNFRVLLPVHFDGNHWILLEITKIESNVQINIHDLYLHSAYNLSREERDYVINNHKQIWDLFRDMIQTQISDKFNFIEMTLIKYDNISLIPPLTNSCGHFVLFGMYISVMGSDPNHSQFIDNWYAFLKDKRLNIQASKNPRRRRK